MATLPLFFNSYSFGQKWSLKVDNSKERPTTHTTRKLALEGPYRAHPLLLGSTAQSIGGFGYNTQSIQSIKPEQFRRGGIGRDQVGKVEVGRREGAGSQGSKSKNTEGRREQEFQELNWFCKHLLWKKLIVLLRNWFWFRVMVNVDVFFCLESLPMLMSFSNNCGSEEASKSSDESTKEQEQLWFDITKSMS